jgi:hypothetical protein
MANHNDKIVEILRELANVTEKIGEIACLHVDTHQRLDIRDGISFVNGKIAELQNEIDWDARNAILNSPML